MRLNGKKFDFEAGNLERPHWNEFVGLVADFEGFESHPYQCPAGVWTIGYGHTFNPMTGQPVGQKSSPIQVVTAKQWLSVTLRDLHNEICAQYAKDAATKTGLCRPMKRCQSYALASFAYNLGTRALFHKSTLWRKLTAQAHPRDVAEEFERWVFVGGKRLRGLVRRRAAERNLFVGAPWSECWNAWYEHSEAPEGGCSR